MIKKLRCLLNAFRPTLKRIAGAFKFFSFDEHFRRAPFLLRISVDSRSNGRNKAAFFIFLQRSVDKAKRVLHVKLKGDISRFRTPIAVCFSTVPIGDQFFLFFITRENSKA